MGLLGREGSTGKKKGEDTREKWNRWTEWKKGKSHVVERTFIYLFKKG